MILNLTDLSAEPLHTQISAQLAARIIDGDICAGAELPTVTSMIKDHHVSRDTVRRAYKDLALQGLIRTERQGHFFVTQLTDERRQAIALCRGTPQQWLLNAIESFSRQLLSVFDTERLCEMLRESVRKFIDARGVHIVLYDQPKGRFTSTAPGESNEMITVDRGDPYLQEIAQAESAVPVEESQSENQAGGLLRDLVGIGARIVFPLKHASRLQGILIIGEPVERAEYSSESLDLLAILANQFVTALTTARFYTESVEKRRMDGELKIAQQIQANLLPQSSEYRGDFDIAAFSTPSHTVVGDYYDYFDVGETRLGVVIADACGKGIPAAILMSQIQAVLKSHVGNGNTIRQTMRDLNRQLETNASAGHFATLFYGIADRSTGRLEFANAGHDFPILVRRNGEVTVLKSTGPALGVVSDLDYGIESVEIREGDYVLLYTDGITETMASNGKEYGALRLRDILIRNRHRDPKEIVQIIKNDLLTFSPGGKPDDDRTLMLLRVNTVGT